MARGNQRDKAREANQKKLADQVGHENCLTYWPRQNQHADSLQKKGNSMSGSEMQREKEKVAQKMREKQAAGIAPTMIFAPEIYVLTDFLADAKKAAEGTAGGKKK